MPVFAAAGCERRGGRSPLEQAPAPAARLVHKGRVRRHRARTDRRSVLVLVTAAGRQVADQATARRR